MSGALRVVVVTGLSGAGESTALRALEDLGFFCADNLPTPLVPRFVEMCAQKEGVARVGLGLDVRLRPFLAETVPVLDELRAARHAVEVLFLDAADDAIARRFSETRRPHPLAVGGGVLDGVHAERIVLAPLRERADRVIDTTLLTPHDLRHAIVDAYASDASGGPPSMQLRLVSFGFKHGLPIDADLVFDARFLPNPHYVDDLRPRSGSDPEVRAYVLAPEAARVFVDRIGAMLDDLLPLYEREGKATLTVAIGCTGGRHRSVALVEALGERLGKARAVRLAHRDVGRG